MNYINHITLTTGQARKSYFNEIDKELYSNLLNLVEQALTEDYTDLEEYSEEFKGYFMKLSRGDNANYMMTLFGTDTKTKEFVPILTSLYSKISNEKLVEVMHSTSIIPLKTQVTDNFVPPYILDRIEIGAMRFVEAMQWTGDFSRCIGWACLFPEKLEE